VLINHSQPHIKTHNGQFIKQTAVVFPISKEKQYINILFKSYLLKKTNMKKLIIMHFGNISYWPFQFIDKPAVIFLKTNIIYKYTKIIIILYNLV
jgi:hypothetical protein